MFRFSIKNSFVFLLFLLFTTIAHATKTVTVKNSGAYNVRVCKVMEATVKTIDETAKILFANDSKMSSLNTEQQNLLQDFCYKSANCDCTTMVAGKEINYDSVDEEQLFVIRPITGLLEGLAALAAALAVVLTFITIGLAAPVITTVTVAGIAGLTAAMANIIYLGALVLTTALAVTSWVSMGLIIGGVITPQPGGSNIEALKELPPVMISLDKKGDFVIPLYNGERLRFTGTSLAQSFLIENDKIKLLAGDAGKFTVYNGGGYTMWACYERECQHLAATNGKTFDYVPGQQLFTIIHGGPAPQSLMVRPNEAIKFWGPVGTPYYTVENSQIKANTSVPPICVKVVGYTARACYGRDCKDVRLTSSKQFDVEEDAFMSIKAVGGNFVKPKDSSEQLAFFEVKPGDTVDLRGTSINPVYSIFPNTCKR